MTLPDTPSVTSSPASADGVTPSASQASQTTNQFGPAPAHASRSARRAKGLATKTSATFGPTSSGSSASADLQRSLANRLQARLATVGSMEYVQTWREKVTPAGRRYWAHTASARPISGSGCTGWLTPRARGDAGGERFREGDIRNLEDQVQLAGWPTPRAEDSESTGAHRGVPDTLTSAARLSGWATPTSRDHKDGDCNLDVNPISARLSRQALISSTAPTGKRGALNPAFSRWLMGYPPAWDDCAVTAMPSSRKSPRSSSPRCRKPDSFDDI